MSTVIAGPSHASRLRMAYETGEVAPPLSSVEWLERPGESMLSPYFRESPIFSRQRRALLFVTDFRLGNRRTVAPEHPKAYSGIDGSLIGPKYDKKLFDESIDFLDSIVSRNPDIRLLFWSLFGREYLNRRSGRYFASGAYRHPVWNLEEVEGRYPRNSLPLHPLIEHPRASSLFSDDSAHPSWLGNEVVTRLVDSPASPEVLFDEVLRTASAPVITLPRPTIFTGHSVWINRVKRMMETSLVSVNNVRFASIREAIESTSEVSGECDYAFISGVRGSTAEEMRILSRQLGVAERLSRASRGEVRMVFWEARAAAAKARRTTLAPGALEAAAAPHSLPLDIARRHVDFHTLDPTLQGVKDVLTSMGASLTWERAGGVAPDFD